MYVCMYMCVCVCVIDRSIDGFVDPDIDTYMCVHAYMLVRVCVRLYVMFSH